MKPNHGQIWPLEQKESIELIERNRFGHLACHSIDDIYVVPITYAAEGGYIYSHSREGKKIEMMRNNPYICIQVEEVQEFNKWKSVIAWGEFEELSGDMATLGMRMLLRRVLSVEKQKQRSELEIDFSAQLESAVIYRMRMQKMTGRLE